MTDKIKRCVNCGTENNADEVLCAACGCMLPANTQVRGAANAKAAEYAKQQNAPMPPPLPQPASAPVEPARDTVVIGKLSIDQDAPPLRVLVTDMDMSFWNLTLFLVKFAFALIPAALIITLLTVFAIGLIKSL